MESLVSNQHDGTLTIYSTWLMFFECIDMLMVTKPHGCGKWVWMKLMKIIMNLNYTMVGEFATHMMICLRPQWVKSDWTHGCHHRSVRRKSPTLATMVAIRLSTRHNSLLGTSQEDPISFYQYNWALFSEVELWTGWTLPWHHLKLDFTTIREMYLVARIRFDLSGKCSTRHAENSNICML